MAHLHNRNPWALSGWSL